MAFGISGFAAQQTYPSPQVFQALSLGGNPPVPPNPPYGNPNENLVPVARTGNPAVPVNLTLIAHPTFQAVLKLTAPATKAAIGTLVTQPNNPDNVLLATNTVLATTPQIRLSSNSTVITQGRPQLAPVANTTSSVDAPNPALAAQVQGPSTTGIPARIDLAPGAVSFQLLVPPASVTSGVDALTQTVAQLQQGQRQAQQQQTTSSANSTNANGANANGNQGTNATPGGSTSTPPTGGPSPTGDPPSTGDPHATTGSQPSTPAPAPAGLVGKIVSTVQSLAIAAVYSVPVFSFSA